VLSTLSPADRLADRLAARLVGLAGTVVGAWVLWRLARLPGGRPELIVGIAMLLLGLAALVWGRTRTGAWRSARCWPVTP
jgi:hypothetical protein